MMRHTHAGLQGKLTSYGDAYLTENFPAIDRIVSAKFVAERRRFMREASGTNM